MEHQCTTKHVAQPGAAAVFEIAQTQKANHTRTAVLIVMGQSATDSEDPDPQWSHQKERSEQRVADVLLH